jgi:hypothetical protein
VTQIVVALNKEHQAMSIKQQLLSTNQNNLQTKNLKKNKKLTHIEKQSLKHLLYMKQQVMPFTG